MGGAIELGITPNGLFKEVWWAVQFKVSLVILVFGVVAGTVYQRAFATVLPWEVEQVVVHVLIALIAVFGITSGRSYRLHAIGNALEIAGVRCLPDYKPSTYAWRGLGFAILAILTLGLSIPWGTISQRRWLVTRWQLPIPADWPGVKSPGPLSHAPPAGKADAMVELLGAEFA